jgi:ABC-type branched-subunit amino acid transport system ATPase component
LSETLIELDDVSRSFGGTRALGGVSLSLTPGEVVGMLGPNGSGKTTLVNCISGVLRPSGGRVLLDGVDATRWSRVRRARNGLVRTYQNLRLFSDMTVIENIEVGIVAQGKESPAARRRIVEAAVEEQNLTEVARTPVRSLSYGQQRRTEIARALVARPRVLLLDEPAAGLGEGERALLGAAIARATTEWDCALLLIDHAVDFVLETSDRIVVLHEGLKLCEGTPEEIQNDTRVADVYLGTPEEA